MPLEMEIEHKKQRGRAGDGGRTKNSLPSFLSFFHSSPGMEMERAEIDFWAYVFVKNSKSIFGHMGIWEMWGCTKSMPNGARLGILQWMLGGNLGSNLEYWEECLVVPRVFWSILCKFYSIPCIISAYQT